MNRQGAAEIMATPNPESYTPTEIPVIDFSGVGEPLQRGSILKQLVHAFENFGFFEAINSSVSVARLDEAFDVSRAFFEQPVEIKREVIVDHEDKSHILQVGWRNDIIFNGMICMQEVVTLYHYHQSWSTPETPISNCDSNANRSSVLQVPNLYPDSVPNYRDKVDDLMESLGEFVDQLLDLISESLELPPTFIRKQYHDNSVPRMLLFHRYPQSTTPEADELDELSTGVALRPHKDATIITIVGEGFDAAGLQINVSGDKWITARPSKGGLVINVGEVLQVWSNGRFKSILHRVMNNKNKDRYSFAYFAMATDMLKSDLLIDTIPLIINAQNPRCYRPFKLCEYFQKRFEGKSHNVLAEQFAIEPQTNPAEVPRGVNPV